MLNLHELVAAQKQENSSRATPSFHSPVSKLNISIIQYLLPFGTNIRGNDTLYLLIKKLFKITKSATSSFAGGIQTTINYIVILKGQLPGKRNIIDVISSLSSEIVTIY